MNTGNNEIKLVAADMSKACKIQGFDVPIVYQYYTCTVWNWTNYSRILQIKWVSSFLIT